LATGVLLAREILVWWIARTQADESCGHSTAIAEGADACTKYHQREASRNGPGGHEDQRQAECEVCVCDHGDPVVITFPKLATSHGLANVNLPVFFM
jgi:hypothetical protein